MSDPAEKSTEVPAGPVGRTEVARDVVLDGRLGLYHRRDEWLAVSDLHFGYEVSRRMTGGLWPMWGMDTVEERLRSLVDAWRPRTLVLVGDVVDGDAAPDRAVDWLSGLLGLASEVVLVRGNHDRGSVTRHFDFRDSFRTGDFLFHHGHREPPSKGDPGAEENPTHSIEITGHLHPTVRFDDGAGTSLRLPAFVRETDEKSDRKRWILPAFSPWAGGHPYRNERQGISVRQWACSRRRVFEASF